jgi:hypothetical protein
LAPDENVLTKGTHAFNYNEMKPFEWNEEKNKWLKIERDVTFEQVVFSIENGKLLDIIRHPSQTKYKGQRVYVIEIEGYAYMVPYVEDADVIFLKTIFPSRKYTKIYLRKDEK